MIDVEHEVEIAYLEMNNLTPSTLASHAYLDLLFEKFNGDHQKMVNQIVKAREKHGASSS